MLAFFHSMGNEGNELLAVWEGSGPQEDVVLKLTEEEPVESWILDMVSTFQASPFAKESPPSVALLDFVGAFGRFISSTMGRPMIFPTDYHRLVQAATDAQMLCEAKGRAIMQELRGAESGRFSLHTHLNDILGISWRGTRGQCCVRCGRSALCWDYQVGLNRNQNRHLLECECCGFVSDVGSRLQTLLLVGPGKWRRGASNKLVVRGQVIGGPTCLVQATALIDSHPNALVHTPGMHVALVGADEAFEFCFEAFVEDDTPPICEKIKAIVLLNGEPHLAFDRIELT
jgi:hypothetical protein